MNPSSTRTPREVEYHYVLTMKLDNGSLVSADGNVLVPPDGNRAGILNFGREVIRQKTGMKGVVTFFTCGPSQLGDGCCHG